MSSAAERHRVADRAEERPGLAKVGRGARGARGVGGAAVSGGARTPLGGDESRRASSTGANPGGGGGERHAVPSRPNRTGTGPAGGIPGGRAGLGTGAPGPGSLVVVGRRGGDRAGLRAAAGEGGRGRAGRARGRIPRGPRGLGEGSRGRPFLDGGGGLLPARGTTGAPLERGGGEGVYRPCRAMSIHGRAAWDYIPNPPRRSPFFGGAEGGGGGWRLLCAPSLVGGGSPVGAPSGLADKTRWRPLGTWAPSRKNLGFAGGDSASMVWYGMVWYGMVWYGVVWCGMVWWGLVFLAPLLVVFLFKGLLVAKLRRPPDTHKISHSTVGALSFSRQ